MQRCPAAPQEAPMMFEITWSFGASGMITMWFLAPAMHWTRFKFSAARR